MLEGERRRLQITSAGRPLSFFPLGQSLLTADAYVCNESALLPTRVAPKGHGVLLFKLGCIPGSSYGPKIEDMEYSKDESETLISSLLKKETDRLDYSCDFGDGWQDRTDLEKILDADDGQLPWCTGGRRKAPLEDSGGPWGWSEKVQIFRVPKCPEHEEVIDWFIDLGLDEADAPNPAHFDSYEINANLEVEF